MPLTPKEIGSIYSDLLSAVRAEKNSRRIRKLDPKFYRNVVEAMKSLEEESIRQAPVNIDEYIAIKQRISQFEREFRSFFQLRFSKILRLSLYEMEEEVANLTEQEKEFLPRVRSLVKEEMGVLTQKEEPKKTQGPSPVAEAQELPQPAARAEKPPQDEYVLVRIIGDQPPIAMPERNYFFRDNDMAHVPRKFADLLVKRKIASIVETH